MTPSFDGQHPNQTFSNKKWYRSPLAIAAAVLLVAALAFGGLSLYGRSVYKQGMEAYDRLDSETALQKFEQVEKLPAVGKTVKADAALRLEEIVAYQTAKAAWKAGDYQEALSQYEQLLTTYDENHSYIYQVDMDYRAAVAEWRDKALAKEDYAQALAALTYMQNGLYQDIVKRVAARQADEIKLSWAEQLLEQESYQEASQLLWEILTQGQDDFSITKAEYKAPNVYEAWYQSAVEQQDYPAVQDACEAYLAWLEEYGVFYEIEEVQEWIAENYLAWGATMVAENQFEQALETYEQAEAYTDVIDAEQVATAKADVYFAWGRYLLGNGELEESAKAYSQWIFQWPDAKYQAYWIPGEAIAPLIAYAEQLAEDGQQEDALAILVVAANAGDSSSTEARVQAMAAHSRLVYASGKEDDLLQALMQVDAGLALSPQEENRQELEALRADLITAISQSTGDLGQWILRVYRANVFDGPLDFPYCVTNLDSSCMTQDMFTAAADVIGIAEEKKFVSNGGLDSSLRAKNPGEAYFAVHVDSDRQAIQSCAYGSNSGGTATLVRYRLYETVTVYDLKTGIKLGEKTVQGTNPEACPGHWSFAGSTDSLEGDAPDEYVITNWLMNFAQN